MKVAITGASGLIGSALCARLMERGHALIRMVRREAQGSHECHWDPETGSIEIGRLSGVDAIVHLAGASVADGRWTSERKRLIAGSRIQGTRLIAQTLAAMDPRPSVLVSASAVGFYGDRADQELTESSPQGIGFLAETAAAWERAADPARAADVRVVHPRTGMVLSRHGGALLKMMPPFRWGVGGPMGSGRQFLPWISLHDMVEALIAMIEQPVYRGPVNMVAPNPVRQKVFAQTLGRVMHRPAFLPAPAFALRMILGREMADQMLLASTRVLPQALIGNGFVFRYPELEPALAAELKV